MSHKTILLAFYNSINYHISIFINNGRYSFHILYMFHSQESVRTFFKLTINIRKKYKPIHKNTSENNYGQKSVQLIN